MRRANKRDDAHWKERSLPAADPSRPVLHATRREARRPAATALASLLMIPRAYRGTELEGRRLADATLLSLPLIHNVLCTPSPFPAPPSHAIPLPPLPVPTRLLLPTFTHASSLACRHITPFPPPFLASTALPPYAIKSQHYYSPASPYLPSSPCQSLPSLPC